MSLLVPRSSGLEKMIEMDTLLWMLGGIGGVIIMLLGIIAYFIKADKDMNRELLNKHEGWILEQQKEIHEISKQNQVSNERIMFIMEQIKK